MTYKERLSQAVDDVMNDDRLGNEANMEWIANDRNVDIEDLVNQFV